MMSNCQHEQVVKVLWMMHLYLHLIHHFLSPSESTTQMVVRSVQPQLMTLWQTDRQTVLLSL